MYVCFHVASSLAIATVGLLLYVYGVPHPHTCVSSEDHGSSGYLAGRIHQDRTDCGGAYRLLFPGWGPAPCDGLSEIYTAVDGAALVVSRTGLSAGVRAR